MAWKNFLELHICMADNKNKILGNLTLANYFLTNLVQTNLYYLIAKIKKILFAVSSSQKFLRVKRDTLKGSHHEAGCDNERPGLCGQNGPPLQRTPRRPVSCNSNASSCMQFTPCSLQNTHSPTSSSYGPLQLPSHKIPER